MLKNWFFCVLALLIGSNSLFAAEIESIKRGRVVLYLENSNDEAVNPGDFVYLTDFNGKTTAKLKVLSNRGLMADTIVVEGTPYKSNDVIMPHMPPPKDQVIEKPPAASPSLTPPAKTAKPTPTPVTSAPETQAVEPELKPTKKKRKKRKRKRKRKKKKRKKKRKKRRKNKNSGDIFEQALADEREENKEKLKAAYENDGEYERPGMEEPEELDLEPSAMAGKRWRVATDILTIAGVFFDYQIYNISLERRILQSLSVGAKINYGTYEANADIGNASNRPQVTRIEAGGEATYNISGDVFDDGFFGTGGFMLINEDWGTTSIFPGATSSSSLLYAILGYQYNFKSISFRLGYQLQQSSMGDVADFGGVQYQRSPKNTRGFFSFPVFSVGYVF